MIMIKHHPEPFWAPGRKAVAQMARIQDVAEKAGVGVATVSRMLNGSG